jgi:hypothetical protein
MSSDVIRWGLGLVVFAHGVGHILFMPVLNGAMRLQASGHSWLLSGAVADPVVKTAATVSAGVALLAFVAAAVGIVTQTPAWRPLAVAGGIVSLAVILAMWDGLPTSSAFFALAFDLALLVALLVAHWPSAETIGA